jgi:hypothetical protein
VCFVGPARVARLVGNKGVGGGCVLYLLIDWLIAIVVVVHFLGWWWWWRLWLSHSYTNNSPLRWNCTSEGKRTKEQLEGGDPFLFLWLGSILKDNHAANRTAQTNKTAQREETKKRAFSVANGLASTTVNIFFCLATVDLNPHHTSALRRADQ